MTTPQTRRSALRTRYDARSTRSDASIVERQATTAVSPAVAKRSRRFLVLLSLIALGGFGIRLVYILSQRHLWVGGDGFSYFLLARDLGEGHGFVNPLAQGAPAAANHPPLWPLLLVLPYWLGAKTFLDYQYFAITIGTASIIAVGYAGRRMLSERAGLLSAAIVAVYAGAWMYERELLSECLVFLGSAFTILAAYRFINRPSTQRAVVLAFACAAMALVRAEQLLLIVFLYAAVVLTLRGLTIGRRCALLAIGACVVIVTLAPWTLYNEHRLHHPVYLTTTMGSAIAQGNCDPVYHGALLGYYDFGCNVARALALPAAVRRDPVRTDNAKRRETPRRR